MKDVRIAPYLRGMEHWGEFLTSLLMLQNDVLIKFSKVNKVSCPYEISHIADSQRVNNDIR